MTLKYTVVFRIGRYRPVLHKRMQHILLKNVTINICPNFLSLKKPVV